MHQTGSSRERSRRSFVTATRPLAGLGSAFNGDYVYQRYNTTLHLIILVEDMIYYPQHVIQAIEFAAERHLSTLDDEERRYLQPALDPRLMELMHYSDVP